MTYARRVVSPLKGGVDIELGEKTCVVGANGKGKTAISQALKLGLLGYVDDQEGRDGVSVTANIARLFSPKDKVLFSDVEMSDGARFRWESSRKAKSGFTKPVPTQPYAVSFPFLTLKALMSGDQKAVRSWLEERAGGAMEINALCALVPAGQRKDAKAALMLYTERSPVEIASKLKKEAAKLRRDATKQEKTIDSVVEGVAVPLADTEIEALKQQQNALRVQLSGGVSQEQYDRTRITMDGLAGTIVQTRALIEDLPEPSDEDKEAARIVQAAYGLTFAHVEKLGKEACFVCLRPGADLEASLAHWASLEAKYIKATSRATLEAEAETSLAQLQQLAEQFKQAKIIDVAGISQQIAEIQGKLAADDVSRRAWQQAEAVRKTVQTNRVVADTYASLGRTWAEEGRRLLEQKKTAFEEGVTKYLPEGEVFRVDLDAGRVGLECGDEVHTSLSGAELTRVLMAVLSSEGEGGSTPTIIEPEDKGWDSDTLASVMKALTSCQDQIILMSTTMPAGVVEKDGELVHDLEGWKIVLLS